MCPDAKAGEGPDFPRVSVVLPTFNRANVLSRSLVSVLAQDYPNFEVIVVDDCSDDDTASVVASMDDARIRYIRLATRHGGGGARNRGIEAASGKLIAFQDSDDEWVAGKLKKTVSTLLQSPDAAAVFSDFQVEAEGSLARSGLPVGLQNQGRLRRLMLTRNVIDTPTSVVWAWALDAVGGFDPSLPRFQDWDLFLRLCTKFNIAYVPEPLLISHASKDGISANPHARLTALNLMYAKHEVLISNERRSHASWHCMLSDAASAVGERSDARAAIKQAIALRPLEVRYWIRLCLLQSGKKSVAPLDADTGSGTGD